MISSKTIGNKIATARKKTHLSQAELAQQVAISSQAVGKWERGESMPDITMLNKLANILGVDLNYFSETFKSNEIEIAHSTIKKEESLISKLKTNLGLNWDMSAANWENADFSGLKNLNEKFNCSNIKNCKFINSELSNLILKSNNIEKTDFSGSEFRNSKFLASNVAKNEFVNCSFIDAYFEASEICNCNFLNANLSGAEFKTSELKNNNFENAIWQMTFFKHSYFSEMVFNGTLENCIFEGCGFSKVTFENAILKNTFFKNNRNLKRIKFVNCTTDQITYEFLKSGNADLTGIGILNK